MLLPGPSGYKQFKLKAQQQKSVEQHAFEHGNAPHGMVGCVTGTA
jgi:hypothetical protein